MKRILLTFFSCLAVVLPVLADDVGAANSPNSVADTTATNAFHSELERASYAIGMYYGHLLQSRGANVDFSTFSRGFQDAQSGRQLLMTPEEMRQTLNEFQRTLIAKQREQRELLAAENKKKSDEFLAENRKKPGVKVLRDGLQYEIITEGKGAHPDSNDVVLVNYRGTFSDGTVFDATSGSPMQESLSEMKIKGLREALPLMKAGSVWELAIPPELAFGANGLGSQIPPNTVLIYTLKLISFGPPGSSLMPATTNAPLTSDVIAVPSAAEMKKGKQPYTIKAEDVQKMQQEMQKTNR